MSRLFDEVVNREGTNSVKWDTKEELFQEEGVLPMWVADMDFKSPQPILDALQEVLNQQVLGYSYPSDSLYQAIINWHKKRHNLHLTQKDILFSPGVVPSLGVAVQALTQPGDAVLIHDPVYPPFSGVVEANNRQLVRSPLHLENNQYRMDLKDMEEKIKEHNIKLLLFCHPHNPGGRVWTEEELIALADLCQKHGVVIVSDEIHSDLTYPSQNFVSFVSVKDEYKDFIVTLDSVTKTFNLAGIKNSMIFVFNEDLREKIVHQIETTELDRINTFGYAGMEAALTHGEEWLNELLHYLQGNLDAVMEFFDEHLPEVSYVVPEATYLIWFNVSSLGVKDEDLQKHFARVGKVGLNDGISYGPGGSQYMRLNFAAPREVVMDGLERVKKVFDQQS